MLFIVELDLCPPVQSPYFVYVNHVTRSKPPVAVGKELLKPNEEVPCHFLKVEPAPADEAFYRIDGTPVAKVRLALVGLHGIIGKYEEVQLIGLQEPLHNIVKLMLPVLKAHACDLLPVVGNDSFNRIYIGLVLQPAAPRYVIGGAVYGGGQHFPLPLIRDNDFDVHRAIPPFLFRVDLVLECYHKILAQFLHNSPQK